MFRAKEVDRPPVNKNVDERERPKRKERRCENFFRILIGTREMAKSTFPNWNENDRKLKNEWLFRHQRLQSSGIMVIQSCIPIPGKTAREAFRMKDADPVLVGTLWHIFRLW
ncbi:Hypothetical protein NTJ_05297 [Nesidiocoris tenuis]|uniref:Uncharacterized protein n=1 Tax=Nesidiocoris tenuis TaxID=355587 RepID=A0ABN7AJQ4_9HEMI|nr:Hypothetical protein NTJ_05297 [Nesidiocoris tenuis]